MNVEPQYRGSTLDCTEVWHPQLPPYSTKFEDFSDSPTSSSSHQEASTDLLSSSIWGQRQNDNHSHGKLTKLITWAITLSNSVKLSRAMYGHTRWIVHSGEFWQNVVHWRRDGKPLQHSCLENPMNSLKRQKDITLKDELPRSVGAQYATGEQWRNNSKKTKEMELKQNNT